MMKEKCNGNCFECKEDDCTATPSACLRMGDPWKKKAQESNSKRREYQRNWYEKNRDEILARHRERNAQRRVGKLEITWGEVRDLGSCVIYSNPKVRRIK